MRRRRYARIALLLFVGAGCSSPEESTPADTTFCREYGEKLAALGCQRGGTPEDIAFICTGGQGSDTRCASEYQTLLRCQMQSAGCAADGSIAFAPCTLENDAYATCRRSPSIGRDAGGETADGDGAAASEDGDSGDAAGPDANDADSR